MQAKDLVLRLLEADSATKKKIAVIGDAMIDVWVHGKLEGSQDGCPKFVESHVVRTPGGAANAARCLQHWNAEAWLIAPVDHLFYGRSFTDGVRRELCFRTGKMPVKTRYIDDTTGRIVFRHDEDWYKADEKDWAEMRSLAVKAVNTMGFDAVLISDYDKGFLDEPTIQNIVNICHQAKIPVICDAKREPNVYRGAIIKANADWQNRFHNELKSHGGHGFITHGRLVPLVHHFTFGSSISVIAPCGHISLVNHVGAGDCFAAHLALCFAHGKEVKSLEDYTSISHSAGRVYVQHPHNRPPWPHEIARDLDPIGGKVLSESPGDALRRATSGRIVFTNGVFRVPHVGHAWMLNWAKQQGDVLVVGVNDSASARRLREGQFVLPLEERVHSLASIAAVDWVIPFAESDPCGIIRQLRPDILVKGAEYQGQRVPGDDLVPEVRFAPPDLFPTHATELVEAMRL